MRLKVGATALAVAAIGLTGCENPVEKAVRRDLIDGPSAKFEEIERCSNDQAVYRGKVNAKNRMGAYVGSEPFFHDGVSTVFAGSDGFMSMMSRCYGPMPGDKPVNPAMGAWEAHDSTNPVDDSKTLVATLKASEGTSSSGEPVTLIIRCQSKSMELFVNWKDYLGSDSHEAYDDWKHILVRVGQDEAVVQRWPLSTDSKASFAPGEPLALIKKILKAQRLVVQTTPFSENPVTAVFQLKGMDVAMKPLAASCGWTP
jgi:hypothetical protein